MNRLNFISRQTALNCNQCITGFCNVDAMIENALLNRVYCLYPSFMEAFYV